eukprot:gene8091-16602_t
MNNNMKNLSLSSKINNILPASTISAASSSTLPVSTLTTTTSTTTSTTSSSSSMVDVVTQSHPYWTRIPSTQRNKQTTGSVSNISSSNMTTSKKVNMSMSVSMLRMEEYRKTLPAWDAREEFLSLMKENRAIVLTGETGCGKTTQIPQYLLEDRPGIKVLVCQPRRLAAVGVAARVAEERGCAVGQEVGHMVRGDCSAGVKTKLLFVTYGVLLRRLQSDPMLEAVDCVILDEVHERGLESDFALALLMSALTHRTDLQLILMSATIQTEKFTKYLGTRLKLTGSMTGSGSGSVSGSMAGHAPLLSIPGRTFHVTEYFRGDFEQYIRSSNNNTNNNNSIKEDKKDNKDITMDMEVEMEIENSQRYWDNILSADRRIGGRKQQPDDLMNYDLAVRTILRLIWAPVRITDHMLSPVQGSILVFLPGVPEINKMTRLLESIDPPLQSPSSTSTSRSLNVPKIRILPLHGALNAMEQRRVFETTSSTIVKVVLSTNVAEASVTIPDVDVVIDTCLVKEMGYDLEKQFIRQFEAKKRSSWTSQKRKALEPHGVPEMLRTPLERLVLQVKAMLLHSQDFNNNITNSNNSNDFDNDSDNDSNNGDGYGSFTLLRLCPDPPTVEAVHTAESTLIRIRALDNSGKLTAMGRHLSELPCSPKIGRLLVYGTMLGVTRFAAGVAGCMGCRSPFLSVNPADRDAVQALEDRTESDYGASIMALLKFQQLNSTSSTSSMKEYCFISSVSQAMDLSHSCNRNSNKPRVLSAVLCAGLYPQLALIRRPVKRFVETMGGALERETVAQDLSFFIPIRPDERIIFDSSADNNNSNNNSIKNSSNNSTDSTINNSTATVAEEEEYGTPLQRVYIHSTSINTNKSSYPSNFLIYGERSVQRNVAFLRETAVVGPYPLLLFGGEWKADVLAGTVTVDNWM